MHTLKMIVLATSLTVATQVASSQTITFSATNKAIPYPVSDVIQGDINRDGYPDFMFGLYASTNIYTYKSDGVGDYVDWTIPTQYCPSLPMALGDFQRNGKQDLLVTPTNGAQCVTYNPTFANYANDGTGIFKLYKQFALTSGAAQAAVIADFNGDKKLDAVVIDGVQLELYYGGGYGSFSGPYKITQLTGTAASLTISVYNLITGDYDGNGCPDVAWTEYEPYGQRGFQTQLKIAYGDCKGGFSVVTQQDIIGEIDSIQTADLNRDGISDIVSALDAAGQGVSDPTLQIFYGQKNRSLTPKLIKDPGLTGPIQVADLNGDGYPDVAYNAVENSISGVKIAEGDAAQSFATSSFYALPSLGNFQLVGSGDYNRDGKTDLALLGFPSGNSQFTMLMNTSAYAQGACVQPATSGIHVCSPGATSGTTVHVLADANNTNPTVYMELWVDGVRRIGYGSTHELRTTLTLGAGIHQFAYFSADVAGNKNSLITNVKVQ